MDKSSPIVVLIGALPALAALLGVFWPTDQRGLAGRLRRALDIREKLPDGEGRDALDDAVDHMAHRLAHLEDMRLRRRIDAGNAATMVVVALIGVGVFAFLWQFEHWVVRLLAVTFATFTALLVFVGGGSRFMTVDDHYPWERPATPAKSDAGGA